MERRDETLGWRELRRTPLLDCGIFEVVRSERQSGPRGRGVFHILESSDWVNVVPLAPLAGGAAEDRLVMVRQFRHGIERITTEFPAGLVEAGEGVAAAAARELAEETGLEAAELIEIGRVAPNPAFMTNWCTTFCARGLRRLRGQELDPLELIDVVEVPLSELLGRIGTGEYVNSMTAVGLLHYLRWRGLAK